MVSRVAKALRVGVQLAGPVVQGRQSVARQQAINPPTNLNPGGKFGLTEASGEEYTRDVARTGCSRSWTRGPRLAIVLFLGVTSGGTLGYMAIEGWSAWDAFYMTIISVTTVGYREVHEMSRAGQAWTAVVLVSGVSTLFYTATLIMSLVVEGGLHRKLDSRRFNRMLDDLTQHFIICGYGRIGSVIADEFRRQHIPYVVIDRDPERVHDAIMKGGLAVEADASREEVLTRVGIARARGLIAAVGTDAENVYTVLTARGLQPGLFIVARVESEDAEAKVRRAGADRVISPYQLGGIRWPPLPCARRSSTSCAWPRAQAARPRGRAGERQD
jgi:hypothetical protein